MKTKPIVRLMTAGAAVMFAGLLALFASCEEPTSSSHFAASDPGSMPNVPNSPSGGGVPGTQDECNDGKDNDWDGSGDRLGVPAHCSIGAPVKTVSNPADPSVVKFYAGGSFNRMDTDTYTVTVVTPGGSGKAQIAVVSANGDNVGQGLDGGRLTVTNGVPIYIGVNDIFYNRVVLYFLEDPAKFHLGQDEQWTFSLNRVTNCTLRPDIGCDHPMAVTERGCDNMADDDGDGDFDHSDSNCRWQCTDMAVWDYECDFEDFFPCYVPQCNDGIDKVDRADTGCANDCDDSE